MRQWKPYTNNRVIHEHPDGFYVIKDRDNTKKCELFCPLCESIMNTSYDNEAYRKFDCCDMCSSNFVYPNLEKWKNGWRPAKEDVMSKLARK